jgi:ParB-like nuclease domain
LQDLRFALAPGDTRAAEESSKGYERFSPITFEFVPTNCQLKKDEVFAWQITDSTTYGPSTGERVMSESTTDNSQAGNNKHHPLLQVVRQLRAVPNQPNRQIELVPVMRLTACKTNARTHSAKQVRQISASLKRFGFVIPVVINAENQIVAGHGRNRSSEAARPNRCAGGAG